MASHSIEIPFEIGETLYSVGSGYREERVTCPECVGLKALRVIQGDGKEFFLPCACCTQGFGEPSGTVLQPIYEHRPTKFIPRRVNVNGPEIMYSEADPSSACYSSVDAKSLFRTEEECLVACKAADQYRKEAFDASWLQQRKSKKRDMAWSVHYWQGQIKSMEADLVRMKARLDDCKAREMAKAFKPLADAALKLSK